MNLVRSVKQSFDLKNKVTIITGGAGLLGEKHAEAVAEFGAIPILLDINKKEGINKSKKISEKYNIDCKFFSCDITDESQIINVKNSLLKSYGKIDILINNASIDPKVNNEGNKQLSRLENFPLDQWNLELSVGLTGAMLCSKIFGLEMTKNSNGVILNISSDLGIIAPDQRIYKEQGLDDNKQPVKPVTYSVIKHGIIGLTKYIASYWPQKIRCNALCPGGVYIDQPDEFVRKILKNIPMNRMAKIDEYKAAIVFLVSDASIYMTGSSLVIDGGRTVL